MVTSEEMFEFVKAKTEMDVIRDAEGTPEFATQPLTGEHLAKALRVVREIVQIEAAAEANAAGLKAQIEAEKARGLASSYPLESMRAGPGDYN